MKPVPHFPYSPDLTLSDFYLFGYVKTYLTGVLFEDAERLLEVIQAVLEGIEKVAV
jgi:Zn-dependent M16 (insulinase) family peptidase